jgi:putative spermidine/putrescine transport system ATP-binding protein
MDEPLGALDKKLREWLQLEFKRIHDELGITFVYVTHDQEEALVLSDRIAVFNEGRIEQVGTADELYENPQTLFVAEFLGESNVFHGKVRHRGDRYVLEGPDFELQACETTVPDGSVGALVVRPERLSVRRGAAAGGDGDNVLTGTVRQVIYLGSARKLEVDLPTGQTILIRESVSAGHAIAAGEQVEVRWAADDSVVVAEQQVDLHEELEQM